MEKLIGYLKRNIKLAFKTVTFHFKEYLCFYIAIFIIEMLFGIITMSASNNLYMDEKETTDNYNYHLVITGVNSRQYEYLEKLRDIDYDENDYAGEIAPPPAYGINKAVEYVKEESRGTGSDRVYDIYYLLDDGEGTPIEDLYTRFNRLYLNDLRALGSNFDVTLSPLYSLSERQADIRMDCAVWIVLLGIVSVVILILLYNIRINHFKFTYGIYMSFGADSKKLFGTCFWEILIISGLTLIPSAIIATVADFLFFEVAGYSYHFAPYLMLFAVLFMVPVVMIAVYLPVKATAVKPPLKLLLAEDNSNLVTSPRISVQFLGKKFPGAYEKISLGRFRKYNIQLVLSSVLFAALFVWTSFYCGIYEYSTENDSPEYIVNFNQNRVVETTEVATRGEAVTSDVTIVRRALYTDDVFLRRNLRDSVAGAFEKFYNSSLYEFNMTETGRQFIDLATGEDVTTAYNTAMGNALISNYNPADLERLEEYLATGDYDFDRNEYGYIVEVYPVVIEEVETVTYVGDTYTSDMRQELLSIPGINKVYKSCSTSAFQLTSHVAFATDDTKINSGFVIDPNDENTSVTMSVNYNAADEELIEYFLSTFRLEGDPYELVEGEKQVIISDSVNNRSVLKINVGDTIRVAKLKSLSKDPAEEGGLEGDRYISFLLENGEFEYETYRVCAIIENMASDSNMSMFFSEDDYQAITGSEALFKEVAVYVDQSLSKGAVETLGGDLRTWAGKYSYTSVDWENSLAESSSERSMRRLPLFGTIAVMLLIISPLFWFFSQIMFYSKRQKEFELLRGMGAAEKEIKKIFITDGIMYAVIGAVTTVLLSAIGVFAINRITLSALSLSAETSNVRYVFEMPWGAAIIAVLASALIGFLSCALPYVIDRAKTAKKTSEEFGASEKF